MTAKELKYIYLEETMSLLGNEELMKAALDAIRKVKTRFDKKATKDNGVLGSIPALQYSQEELNRILDQAEADQLAGNYTPSNDVFNELRNEFPFLCKSFG